MTVSYFHGFGSFATSLVVSSEKLCSMGCLISVGAYSLFHLIEVLSVKISFPPSMPAFYVVAAAFIRDQPEFRAVDHLVVLIRVHWCGH